MLKSDEDYLNKNMCCIRTRLNNEEKKELNCLVKKYLENKDKDELLVFFANINNKYSKLLEIKVRDSEKDMFYVANLNIEYMKDMCLINIKCKNIVINNYFFLCIKKIIHFLKTGEKIDKKITKKRKIDEIDDIVSKKMKKIRIPNEFLDPITREIMIDPVFCPLGYTYERESLVKWLKFNDTTPKTGELIQFKKITPNYSMRSLIQDFKERIRNKNL